MNHMNRACGTQNQKEFGADSLCIILCSHRAIAERTIKKSLVRILFASFSVVIGVWHSFFRAQSKCVFVSDKKKRHTLSEKVHSFPIRKCTIKMIFFTSGRCYLWVRVTVQGPKKGSPNPQLKIDYITIVSCYVCFFFGLPFFLFRAASGSTKLSFLFLR